MFFHHFLKYWRITSQTQCWKPHPKNTIKSDFFEWKCFTDNLAERNVGSRDSSDLREREEPYCPPY